MRTDTSIEPAEQRTLTASKSPIGHTDLGWLLELRRANGVPRLSVLNGMYLVWMIRADLRDAFDLTTEIGAIAYWQWWLTHGRKEYPYVSFCLNEALRTFLSEPTDKVVQDTPVPIPLMLYLLWSSREDMRRTFDLDTREGREGLAHWWSEHGFQDQSELTVCVKSPESLPPTLIPQVQQHEFR